MKPTDILGIVQRRPRDAARPAVRGRTAGGLLCWLVFGLGAGPALAQDGALESSVRIDCSP